ncbi:hypothetical protein CDIK_3250 [Cucumispora dikerogammari]|nr:hypothetical protein CDIK_3250 [Cucumispora dikerogammari]
MKVAVIILKAHYILMKVSFHFESGYYHIEGDYYHIESGYFHIESGYSILKVAKLILKVKWYRRPLSEKLKNLDGAVSFCMNVGLIKKSSNCKFCRKLIILANHRCEDGFIWTC